MKDTTRRLEELLAQSNDGKYVLQLYAAGLTPQSRRAIENLKAICDTHLPGRYELTIVDIYQQPDRAHEEQVIAAPTLVKTAPLPLRRLIGDLSDTGRVLLALGLRSDTV